MELGTKKNKNINLLILAFLLLANNVFASNFHTQKNDTIILDNGLVNRKIVIKNNNINSVSFKKKDYAFNFASKSKEFSFLLNDSVYDGNSSWKLTGKNKISDKTGGHGIQLILESLKAGPKFSIEINYLLYPDYPIVRKWMVIHNIGKEDIKLEALNVEDMQTNIGQTHA